MATANAAATLERADDFASDYAAATLVIKSGANVLATHTFTGFVTSNSGVDAVATANAIADATITGTGTQTADSAELSAAGKTYTLTVDTTSAPLVPAADLRFSTLMYINGETSSVPSFSVNFLAQ